MIYNLLCSLEIIAQLETLIGNGAKVRLSLDDDALWVRVDWYDDDFHGMKVFTQEQLRASKSDKMIEAFVVECRYKYDNRNTSK